MEMVWAKAKVVLSVLDQVVLMVATEELVQSVTMMQFAQNLSLNLISTRVRQSTKALLVVVETKLKVVQAAVLSGWHLQEQSLSTIVKST